MRATKKLGKPLSVRVTDEMYAALLEEAKHRHLRLPDLVRMALSDLLRPRPDPNRPLRDA